MSSNGFSLVEIILSQYLPAENMGAMDEEEGAFSFIWKGHFQNYIIQPPLLLILII